MHTKQIIYGVLAIAGFVATWYFNLQILDTPEGLSFDAFVAASYANPYVGTLTNDLNFAFLTFLVWMVIEARRLAMAHWWIYIVVAFTVAFAVAFPLFLMMRERRLDVLEAE